MAVSHKSDGILQGTKLINLCILGYCRRDFHTHTYVYIYIHPGVNVYSLRT